MRKKIISMLLCLAIGLSLIPAVSAAGTASGLKNVYRNSFRIGAGVSSTFLNSAEARDFIAGQFNSVTCSDELKPDATLDQAASQSIGHNTDTQVKLSSGARTILAYCETNRIPVRGKCLVWYSQTPKWFFREGFNTNGPLVSEEIMDQRLESYIRNLFALIAHDYPDLKICAWDVVTEAFNDATPASLRPSSQSDWTAVYGSSDYIYKAFRYAQKYKPDGCLLCYNDYNEYVSGKIEAISDLCEDLYKKGLLDAIGLESHLTVGYPAIATYRQALETYASIGCPLMITELDVARGSKSESEQAAYYKDLFELYVEYKDSIESVTFDSTTDSESWRSSEKPLLFGSGRQPKDAYYSVLEAADGESRTISVIDLEGFVPPVPGADPCGESDVSAPDGAHYTFGSFQWFEYSDGPDSGVNYMTSEKFEEGKWYYFKARIYPDDGYRLASSITYQMNGSTEYVDTVSSQRNGLLYSLDLKAEERHVDTIRFNDFAGFYAGDTPEILLKRLTVPAGSPWSLLDRKDLNAGWIAPGGDGYYIKDTAAFTVGKNYKFIFRVKADDGWVIDADTQWIVNGGSVELGAPDYDDSGYWFCWTEPIAAKEQTVLDDIYVSGYEKPVTGKTTGECLNIYSESSLYKVIETVWYNDTDTYYMDSDDVFEDGKEYSVRTIVKPTQYGYCMTDETVPHLNGDDGIITFDFGGMLPDVPYAFCFWTSPMTEDIAANKIDVYVTCPVAGEKPDDEPICVSDPVGAILLNSSSWCVYEPADSRWREMGSGETFETGRRYAYNMFFNTAAGYILSDSLKGYVNDQKYDGHAGAIRQSDRTAYMAWEFEPLTPVSRIDVSVTAPAIGENPEYYVGFTTVPASAVILDDLIWYRWNESRRGWDTMKPNETFEEGSRYSIELYFMNRDGYGFIPSMAGTVNGQPHDDTGGDVYRGANESAYLSYDFGVLSSAVPTVLNYTKDSANTDYATVTFENSGRTAVVSCDSACAVIVKTADNAYTRLTGTKRSDSVYTYDLSGISGGSTLIVALRGDANLDGYINSTDLGQARGVMSKKLIPDDLKMLVMDLMIDRLYNSTDLGQLRAVLSGKLKLAW